MYGHFPLLDDLSPTPKRRAGIGVHIVYVPQSNTGRKRWYCVARRPIPRTLSGVFVNSPLPTRPGVAISKPLWEQPASCWREEGVCRFLERWARISERIGLPPHLAFRLPSLRDPWRPHVAHRHPPH